MLADELWELKSTCVEVAKIEKHSSSLHHQSKGQHLFSTAGAESGQRS